MSRLLALIPTALLVAMLSGCHPEPISSNAKVAPGPPVQVGGPIKKITKGNPGPVKLGMAQAELQRLPNVTVQPVDEKSAKKMGITTPSVTLIQGGLPMALAELEDGKVSQVRYYTPIYETPEGAHVGTRAQELGKLYGGARLDRVHGGLCARFDREPEYRFCFVVPNAGNVGSWEQLQEQNPRVKMVIVSKLLPAKPMRSQPGLITSPSTH